MTRLAIASSKPSLPSVGGTLGLPYKSDGGDRRTFLWPNFVVWYPQRALKSKTTCVRGMVVPFSLLSRKIGSTCQSTDLVPLGD